MCWEVRSALKMWDEEIFLWNRGIWDFRQQRRGKDRDRRGSMTKEFGVEKEIFSNKRHSKIWSAKNFLRPPKLDAKSPPMTLIIAYLLWADIQTSVELYSCYALHRTIRRFRNTTTHSPFDFTQSFPISSSQIFRRRKSQSWPELYKV